MNATAMRLALLAGVALAATCASTVVAWKFQNQPVLGGPWFGWLYNPLSAWHWWQAWGHAEPHRELFLEALTLCALLLIMPAAIAYFAQLYGPLKPRRDQQAGFGTVKKLLRTGHIRRSGDGVVLGCDPGRWWWQQRTLRDNGDSPILIMGPTRSGKGAGHVIPTLLSHSGSTLVFDPKRELSAITGQWRATLGQVFVIDPTSAASARFNPLLELREDHLIGDCQTMALHMTTEERPHSGDPYWKEAARNLLSVLLFLARTGDEPTLGKVWRTSLEIAAGRFPTTTNWWAAAILTKHRKLPEKTRAGVDGQLDTYLKWLADPLTRNMLSASDFRAGDLTAAAEPVTVFLSIPIRDGQRLRPLTSMLLEAMISSQTADLEHTADGRRKRRPMLGLLDEFPQLGKLDVIERQMKLMAGYKVRLCLVCQDEKQIADIYGTHQSVTANCSTIAFIPGYGDSLQTVARWGGQHLVAQSSKQLAASLRGSSSMSQSEADRPLLDPGQMLQRSGAEVLIFTTGGRTKRRRVQPTYLDKGRYWKLGEFRGRWDEQEQIFPQPAPVQLPEPEPIANELGDNLEAEDAAMVASAEELVQAMPAAAQAALRHRLGA